MDTQARTSQAVELRAPKRSGGLPIHVLLVDDHPAIRRGLRQLIADEPDLATIAEAANATDAIGELAGWADVAVVDYHLSGRDGLWLTQRIKRRPRPPRVLIYSAFAEHALAVAAIVAGADGLLAKDVADEQLCRTIRLLARGRRHFPSISTALARALGGRLDPRDRAIFDGLLAGQHPQQLRSELQISADELSVSRAAILQVLAPSVFHPARREVAPEQ